MLYRLAGEPVVSGTLDGYLYLSVGEWKGTPTWAWLKQAHYGECIWYPAGSDVRRSHCC